MRRALLALAILAATAAVCLQPTFANFTQTRANSSALSTASSFAPVVQTAPQLVRTGTPLVDGLITLTPGTWAMTHPNGSLVITTSEPPVSVTGEQWQWCQSGTCHNFANAGNTLALNSTLLTALSLVDFTGVTFKVIETASNGIGSATSTAGPA